MSYKLIRKSKSVQTAGVTSATTALDATVLGIPALSTIRINPTAAGSAKLQSTTSPYEDVKAGTGVWDDLGTTVSAKTSTVAASAYTGIRIVVTTGTWTLEVAGNGDQ